MSASNGGAGKTFTARDIAKSKVAKHLSDPFTARDLFGVVRAHCLAPGCACAAYWKATKDYTVRTVPQRQGHKDLAQLATHVTSRRTHLACVPSVFAVLGAGVARGHDGPVAPRQRCEHHELLHLRPPAQRARCGRGGEPQTARQRRVRVGAIRRGAAALLARRGTSAARRQAALQPRRGVHAAKAVSTGGRLRLHTAGDPHPLL